MFKGFLILYEFLNPLFFFFGRCLGTQYQIPVLVNESEISSPRKIELEKEIVTVLEANRNDANKSKNDHIRVSFKILWKSMSCSYLGWSCRKQAYCMTTQHYFFMM